MMMRFTEKLGNRRRSRFGEYMKNLIIKLLLTRAMVVVTNGRSYYYYTATSDFIVVAGFNDDRMGESIAEGMRSQSFSGYNTSGFSLIGGGLRDPDNGYFRGKDVSYWAYPEEHDYDKSTVAHDGSISSLVDNPPTKESGVIKLFGVSVRCTKLE